MAVCGICANRELAEVINQLLFEEIGLDVIAEKTGAHRSSIFRHKKSCFVAWRAARLKAKSGKTDGAGRLIVSWPALSSRANLDPEIADAYYSHYGQTISASDLRADDDILLVRYRPPVPQHAKTKIDGIQAGPSSDQSLTA
jgi:hypothetical protein